VAHGKKPAHICCREKSATLEDIKAVVSVPQGMLYSPYFQMLIRVCLPAFTCHMSMGILGEGHDSTDNIFVKSIHVLRAVRKPVTVAHFLPIYTPEPSRTWREIQDRREDISGEIPGVITSTLALSPIEEPNGMAKPLLDRMQVDDKDIYAFIGRVSLLLVEHNIDAITATTFLREIAEAGGSTLSLEQARGIAQNYVDMSPSRPADREP
jgi:hypothetical protein